MSSKDLFLDLHCVHKMMSTLIHDLISPANALSLVVESVQTKLDAMECQILTQALNGIESQLTLARVTFGSSGWAMIWSDAHMMLEKFMRQNEKKFSYACASNVPHQDGGGQLLMCVVLWLSMHMQKNDKMHIQHHVSPRHIDIHLHAPKLDLSALIHDLESHAASIKKSGYADFIACLAQKLGWTCHLSLNTLSEKCLTLSAASAR